MRGHRLKKNRIHLPRKERVGVKTARILTEVRRGESEQMNEGRKWVLGGHPTSGDQMVESLAGHRTWRGGWGAF